MAKYDVNAEYMGSNTSQWLFRAFSDLHGKISDRSVCNNAGFIQTSENVCIPDVSANSVLVLSYMPNMRLRRRNKS